MTTMLSNLDRLQKEVFEGLGIDWMVSQRLGPDLPYTKTCDAWYFNKLGTDRVYVQPKSPGDALATCFECGTNVAIKSQTINVWNDGLGPCAVEKTRTRQVRYCPTCEEEPKSSIVRWK
jgi:hypothetical protein